MRRYRLTAAAAALTAVAAAGAFVPSSATAAPTTSIVVAPGQDNHPISRLIFGANNNYAAGGSGLYDAAQQRVYPDFVAQVKQIGLSSLRFPGGTMANTYHFTRAIGPQATRTDNTNGVLNDPEPLANTFGPDEYGRLLDQTGVTGNLMLNFGTGTPEEAADFVEYMTAQPGTNPNGGTAWADVRARNGHSAPYRIGYAEIGNELNNTNQGYWMSGASSTSCASPVNCLYARGGTTTFTKQPAVGDADWRESASHSNGAGGQVFHVRYAPIVPDSQTVYVAGTAWAPVTDIGAAAGDAHVYQLDAGAGTIRFGDGTHGAVPPADSAVTVSYGSGPHAGFDAFYAAVKRADPQIQVCSSVFGKEFLQLMGSTHPYDCVVQHEYENGPTTGLERNDFHDQLMLSSTKLGQAVTDLQQTIKQTAGAARAQHISVVATEYGELGATVPRNVPHFHLSLDEGIFIADLLRQWAQLGVPLAEKAKLTDYVFAPTPPATQSVGFPENAMLAGPAPGAVVTPTAQVLQLLSHATGSTYVGSEVHDNRVRTTKTGPLAALTTLASRDASGRHLYLTVINRDRAFDVPASVDTGTFTHAGRVSTATLDGPSLVSYNTPNRRDVTTITRSTDSVGHGSFDHTFPAHSITTFTLDAEAH